MKQLLILACIALITTACSMDEESKAKLESAKAHAKQAVKEVGDVVSKQAAETQDKWKEMNANRIEEAPKEDLGFEPQKADTEDLSRRLKAAKEAFFKEPEKQIEQSKQSADSPQKEG